MSGYRRVLDASALLAMLHAEAGGELVEEAMEGAAVSAVNWSEVEQHSFARGVDVADLRVDVEALGLDVVPFGVEDATETARLWGVTRSRGLSLADRACLSLARRLGVPALTADRAWLDLDVGVDVEAIR